MLADFEERVEVFEPPLIPDLPPPQPPRLVDRREPPATPSVVEARHPIVRMPRMLGLRLPGPHRLPWRVVCFAASRRRSAGEAVGAVESSSSATAPTGHWPTLLKESGRLLWAYGIGEASEYAMHLAMQLRTAALRISDTE